LEYFDLSTQCFTLLIKIVLLHVTSKIIVLLSLHGVFMHFPKLTCDTREFITNSKCPLCIPPQSQNHCCDIHNIVGNQFHRHYNTNGSNTMVIVTKFILQHNIAAEITSSGPCLHPTGNGDSGDDLSSDTLLHNLHPNTLPHSLAKLIARDTAMSTLDALTNHLINEMMK
jgi:hypothetical protein